METYGGTQATVATTTKLETWLMVAMLDVGTLLIAHSADTTTGLDQVDGTEIVTAITENDEAGTVEIDDDAIEAITLFGTDEGTLTQLTTTADDSDGIVKTCVKGNEVTYEALTTTGEFHVEGTVTTLGTKTN